MSELLKISLPDGSVREMPQGSNPADVAAAIGPGLAKAALAARVDGELRDLNRPFDGDAQVALVTGEPGIGKSRLVAELARHAADDGATVATTRVYETVGRLPFGPVADWLRTSALRPVVGRLEPTWRREVARLVPDLLPGERPGREGDVGDRRLLLDAFQ